PVGDVLKRNGFDGTVFRSAGLLHYFSWSKVVMHSPPEPTAYFCHKLSQFHICSPQQRPIRTQPMPNNPATPTQPDPNPPRNPRKLRFGNPLCNYECDSSKLSQ
ncbi:hypothetical protein MHJ92_08690, partial [Corynebacterium amycolatum]|uniref:hypothetical protein n=1 Tax=Corynebacterium amycolatum TaxID=43765 RepID=UPI001EF74985